MISVENIQGLEQGFCSNKREVEESELEEGEACSYHDDDDDDSTIDPDVALSYIDEKLQNYLGHFKKDFEGVVSAESLGAKFGIYGSFLPAHRRSPHSRTPPRVQNNITPQLQVEGGHSTSLLPANVSSSTKQGSFNYKPPQRNELHSQNTSTKSIKSLKELTPKSKVCDQKTLKVRIKVGSENLSLKNKAEIYSGLGLDGSPISSPDASPMESQGLTCKLSFDSFESPTRILKQIMVSPSLFEGSFLSPLSNDLIFLRERPLKENVIDDVSCEDLVSSSLKLPFLSNVDDDMKNSPKASLNERVFNDPLNKEPFEQVSTHLTSSKKSNGTPSSLGKPLSNRVGNAGNVKSEMKEGMADFGTSSKSKKIPKIGPKDLKNHEEKSSPFRDDGIDLPFAVNHTSLGDEKRPKKKVHKDEKNSDNENKVRRNEVQKESTKVKDQYVDVFGDMNEPDVDIMDSLDVDTPMLPNDDTFRERKSSLDARKGAFSKVELRGSTNGTFVVENVHPVFEPVSNHVDGNDNWVQCDKCQKWRMFPPGSKVDNLPPEWDCSLMTWLPSRNHCGVSEEESNYFHAPPIDMTATYLLRNVRSNGKIPSKDRKSSNSFFQNSPNGLSSSIKNNDQLMKDKTMKEAKELYKAQSKSSDIYKEAGQHKKIDNHRSDSYSDEGHDKVKKRKSKRDSDQEFPSTFKKSKPPSIQNGDNNPTSVRDQDVDILGVSSKNDINGVPSFDKMRKSDNFNEPLISTPSSLKLDNDEKSDKKRHKTSKSEGKESNSSKRSGKGDKKSKSVSHQKSDTNESLQKDSSFVKPVVGPTSSSSKASGSFKVKCKFPGLKGSPVESVSSSPLRTLNAGKLASESKVKVRNDDVPSVVKMERNGPLMCSTDNEGGQLSAIRKDSFLGSPNHSMIGIEDKKVKIDGKEQDQKVKADEKCVSTTDKIWTSNILQPYKGNKGSTSTCDAHLDIGLSKDSKMKKKFETHNGNYLSSKNQISNGHTIKTQEAPSPLRRDSSCQAASSAIKEAKDLKHLADRLKNSGSMESTGMYFEAALKFLYGASLLESGKNDNHKHPDFAQSIEMYSSTAKLCQFCAHEFEKSRDMANAALAYKCVEVAYLRVIYASRDRHELQHALQMLPPGESPSSSASDIDNLNNTAIADKITQPKSSVSPQLATNLVIAAKNRANFSRILSFTQDVNFAMEASRKSRIAFAALNSNVGHSKSKDEITSIKKALDFNFHDVDGLLRLVRLAKEAIIR